jgi:RNA polymerase sigma-70 factor (ECF subfamily)
VNRTAQANVHVEAVQTAVQGLYERHGARVQAYCRRRLRSEEEAEDAVQTTFLYACRGLQRGVVPESEIAWLLKIAHNVCLSTWDSDRRRRRLELVQAPDLIEELTPAAPAEPESVMALETALGDLTDLQRRAILLREWRGLSYREIAEELELSQAAVETLIFRARRTLARSLDRQDVARPGTLARCLDVGGLLSALKSAFGLGGSAKLAAGLIGAAVLAGSIPDTPERPAVAQPKAPTRAQVSAPLAVPVLPDPVTWPAAAEPARKAKKQGDRRAAAKEKRAVREQPRRSQSSGGAVQAPSVGQTLGETVEGVTGTVNGTVGGVTKTVDETVSKVLPPVLDVVEGVVGGVGGQGGPGGGGGLLP